MSIRRVSSRQRLVSWDAFDATTLDVSSDSGGDADDECCLRDVSAITTKPRLSSTSFLISAHVVDASDAVDDSSQSPLKRKRRVIGVPSSTSSASESSEQFIMHAIPIHDEHDWSGMPQEVQLSILQFLDVKELRSMSQVNRSQRRLLTTSQASVEALWKPACVRQWPWLQALPTPLNLVDSFRSGNYSTLLLHAAEHAAMQIDASLFAQTRWSRSRRAYVRFPTELKIISAASSRSGAAVQFTGAVGVGDRCIRADAPLPRPRRGLNATAAESSTGTSLFSRLRNTQPILCRNHHSQQLVFKPFCAPFVGASGQIHLTPRLVSYFEVSIWPAPADFSLAQQHQRPRFHQNHHQHQHHHGLNHREQQRTTTAPECVAVGLATDAFSLHTRMPGWDAHSFGYHGDDGGIFHAAGSMIKEYGSRFGANDTVGCGMDYQRQAIFYTLNGTFLGYAFELKEPTAMQDLYPVVGMDTNCPVSCNFGTTTPFQFDLAGMIAKHEAVVLHAMHARCDV